MATAPHTPAGEISSSEQNALLPQYSFVCESARHASLLRNIEVPASGLIVSVKLFLLFGRWRWENVSGCWIGRVVELLAVKGLGSGHWADRLGMGLGLEKIDGCQGVPLHTVGLCL